MLSHLNRRDQLLDLLLRGIARGLGGGPALEELLQEGPDAAALDHSRWVFPHVLRVLQGRLCQHSGGLSTHGAGSERRDGASDNPEHRSYFGQDHQLANSNIEQC